MLLYLVVTQLQCVGRPGNKDEPVVGQGRNAELKSWLTARQRAACILTHPCPSLDASLPNGRTLRQSKDLIESPRLHSPRRGTCVLDDLADRTESSSVSASRLPQLEPLEQ